MPVVTRFFQRISRHAPLSGDRLPSEDEIPRPPSTRLPCDLLTEKKVRRHMLRARKRKGFGWTRWSRQWLYETLRLFNGYRVRRPLSKVAPAG
jgi:hypothetical protein